eukprot:4059859-Pyramimonas_sp.AAC.1
MAAASRLCSLIYDRTLILCQSRAHPGFDVGEPMPMGKRPAWMLAPPTEAEGGEEAVRLAKQARHVDAAKAKGGDALKQLAIILT